MWVTRIRDREVSNGKKDVLSQLRESTKLRHKETSTITFPSGEIVLVNSEIEVKGFCKVSKTIGGRTILRNGLTRNLQPHPKESIQSKNIFQVDRKPLKMTNPFVSNLPSCRNIGFTLSWHRWTHSFFCPVSLPSLIPSLPSCSLTGRNSKSLKRDRSSSPLRKRYATFRHYREEKHTENLSNFRLIPEYRSYVYPYETDISGKNDK